MILAPVVIAFLLILIGFCVAVVQCNNDYSAYEKEQAARRSRILTHHTKVRAAKLASEHANAEAVQ